MIYYHNKDGIVSKAEEGDKEEASRIFRSYDQYKEVSACQEEIKLLIQDKYGEILHKISKDIIKWYEDKYPHHEDDYQHCRDIVGIEMHSRFAQYDSDRKEHIATVSSWTIGTY